MIDLHFHCLPGIDDGPHAWDDAVALCRRAAEEGTTHVVATPHVLREYWLNDSTAARDELLARLNEMLGGSPVVLPGCEYYFSSDAVELWEDRARGPLIGLNRSRYLLLEFPSGSVPRDVPDVLYEMRFAGAVPLIAHPERNLLFSRDPAMLAALVESGARTQITAGSLLGEFGVNAREAAELFYARGLVHVVASDAHDLDRRPPRLRAAFEWATAEWGSEAASRIFEHNARAVIENRELA